MSSSSKQNIKKSKIQLLHQYYSYTGFYTFVRTSLKKAIPPTLIFIFLLWIIHNFVINFNLLFNHITTTFNPLSILAVFFTSESVSEGHPDKIFFHFNVICYFNYYVPVSFFKKSTTLL